MFYSAPGLPSPQFVCFFAEVGYFNTVAVGQGFFTAYNLKQFLFIKI